MITSPVYDRDGVTVYHGDCLALLPELRGRITAIVADPPYGMGWDIDSTRFSWDSSEKNWQHGEGRKDWGDIAADDEPFDPSPWLNFPKVILWGANHYAAQLPVGTTLVWVKRADHLLGTFLSDAEIGWQKGGYGVYVFQKQFPPPSRIAEGGRKRAAHPTQKPIALMAWCINRLRLSPAAVVCDPYAGSGSTAIACRRLGLPCILIEKDDRYIPVIIQRLRECETPLFRGLGEPA